MHLMRYLVISILLFYILQSGCTPHVSRDNVSFEGVENIFLETHTPQKHTLHYQVVLFNKSKQTVNFELIGLETFANGLKIGELFCESDTEIEAGDTLRYNCSHDFRTEDIGSYTKTVLNKEGLPEEVSLNFFGTAVIKSGHTVIEIPIEVSDHVIFE
jgi:hypothetical protein